MTACSHVLFLYMLCFTFSTAFYASTRKFLHEVAPGLLKLRSSLSSPHYELRRKNESRLESISKAYYHQKCTMLDFHGTHELSKVSQQYILKSSSSKDIMHFLFENSVNCNHVNVCTALYRIAKLSKKHPLQSSDILLLHRLIDVAKQILTEDRFTARHLSNLAVALATVNYSDSTLLSIISENFLSRVYSAKIEEMCMILWAFATLRCYESSLFETVLGELQPRIRDLQTKELCTLCWASSTVNHFDKHLMESVAAVFTERSIVALNNRKSLAPHDVSMMAWAFTHHCISQWTLQTCAVNLFKEAVEPQVILDVSIYRPTDLTQLITAMSKLSYDSEELLRNICKASYSCLIEFSPREISALLFSMAKLDYSDEQLLKALSKLISRHLAASRFSKQEIANMTWAMAVLQMTEPTLIQNMFIAIQELGPLNKSELHQLHQAWLVFSESDPNIFKNVDRNLLASAAASWREEKQRPKTSSSRHIDVSKCLSLMHIDHRNESDHDIDIEVVGMGLQLVQKEDSKPEEGHIRRPHVALKLALEVDGPGHYTCNTHRPLGHTVLKHRILEQMGWKVVQIPYFHWDKIPFWASMERKRYLQRKLGITRTLYFGDRDWSTYAPISLEQKNTRFD